MAPDTARADGGDVLTVLRVADPARNPTAKVHTWSPHAKALKRKAFNCGKWFTVEIWPVAGFGALADAIARLADDPARLVIRGALKAGLDPRAAHMRRSNPRTEGRARKRVEPAFESAPRRWLAIDVDRLTNLEGHDPATDPDAAAEYIVEHLPPEFQAASYALQWTSSQNLDVLLGRGTPATLSARLWFWLDRPLSNAEASAWLCRKGKDGQQLYTVDGALFRTVQPHYMAAPIWRGRPDPLPARVYVWQGEDDVVAVPEIAPETPSRRHLIGDADASRDIAFSGETLPPHKARELIGILGDIWAGPGNRNAFSLALAGWMLRKGLTETEAETIIREAAYRAGDEEAESRATAARVTADKLRAGSPCTGWRAAAAIVGSEAMDRADKACAPRRNTRPPLPRMPPAWPAEGLVDLAEGERRAADAIDRFWQEVERHHGWDGGSAIPAASDFAAIDRQSEGEAEGIPFVHALAVTMGGGKTHATIASAARLPAGATMVHFVHDHALGRELLARYQAAGLPARIVRGMTQVDDDGAPMCTRHEEQAIWQAGRLKARDLCNVCPNRAGCRYLAQWAAKGEPGVVIAPHVRTAVRKSSTGAAG